MLHNEVAGQVQPPPYCCIIVAYAWMWPLQCIEVGGGLGTVPLHKKRRRKGGYELTAAAGAQCGGVCQVAVSYAHPACMHTLGTIAVPGATKTGVWNLSEK